MSKFTGPERDNYARFVGTLMKGDSKRKELYDAKIRRVISAMRDSMPSASDEVLAEFSSSVVFIAAVLLKTSFGEGPMLLQELYDNYSIVVAQLIGVYDPNATDVPNYERPDLSAALAGLDLDPETIRRVEAMIADAPGDHSSPRQPAGSGMYL